MHNMCIVNEVIRRVDKRWDTESLSEEFCCWFCILLWLLWWIHHHYFPYPGRSSSQHSTDSTTGYTKHTVHWLHHQVQVSEYYGKRRSMGQKSKVSYTAFEVLIKTRLYTFNPNNFATLLINLAGCPIRLQSRTYLLCTFTTRAQWLEWLL